MATLDTLQDLFSGSSLDGTKWTTFTTGTGSSVTEGSGQVSIASPPGNNFPCWSAISSQSSYDLTGSFGYVHVVQTPANSSSFGIWLTQTQVAPSPTPVSSIRFVVIGTTLTAAWHDGTGAQTTVRSAAWNSTSQAWLRVRESGGTTFYDTSSDGSSWTNFTSVANPVTITSLFAMLYAYPNGAGATGGVAGYADFNTTGAASVTGVGAQVTVQGGVGTPAGSANVTGVAAPVPVASPAGTPAGSANVTGVAAQVPVASPAGTPSAGASITGTAAQVPVAAGIGTPAGSANVTGVAAPVLVQAAIGSLIQSANVQGIAALVTVGCGIGSAKATGLPGKVTFSQQLAGAATITQILRRIATTENVQLGEATVTQSQLGSVSLQQEVVEAVSLQQEVVP